METLYLVGYTRSVDHFVSMARFNDISEALAFLKAQFEKYYAEPNMSLTIMRVDKKRVVENAGNT